MPKGNKLVGIFNDKKVLFSDCGAQFKGSSRQVHLIQKLHIKKCPICIKNSAKPVAVSELYSKNMGRNKVKINGDFCLTRYNSFISDRDTIQEYRKYKQALALNDIDLVKGLAK